MLEAPRPAGCGGGEPLPRDIEAKQRNVDMVRRPRLEHRRRNGPVRMRNIRMHEADRTVGGLDRHRDRHAGKRSTPAPVLGAGNTPEPLGPTQRRRAPVRIEPVQERTFVIAHDHGLEAGLEPHQRLGRVRTAVDQIADAERTVGSGIKSKLGQSAIQGAKAAVDRRQRQDRARADWREPCESNHAAWSESSVEPPRRIQAPAQDTRSGERCEGPSTPAVKYCAQFSVTSIRRPAPAGSPRVEAD